MRQVLRLCARLAQFRRRVGVAPVDRRSMGILMLLTVFTAGINVCEPIVLKYIFDQLSGPAPLQPLMVGVGLLVALGIAREFGGAGSNWLTWKTRITLHFSLLETMVGRLHTAPLSFHRSEGVGAIMTKLDRSIQGFLNAATQLLYNAFPAFIYLTVAIFVMWDLSPALTALVLCFAPIPAAVAAFASSEQTQRERSLFDRWVKIYARFNEVLAGILTVRSFAMEDREKRRFLDAVDSANKVVVRGVRTDATYAAAGNLVILAARVATIALGGALVIRGAITLGTVVAFLGYVGGLFAPVQGLSGIYQSLRKASVSMDEMEAIFQVEQLEDLPGATDLRTVRGDVEFANVHFAYEPGLPPVLRGINLRARAGETIALVGPSGAGKSTVTSLLMRFCDPTAGTVRLDGMDVRELTQASIRRQIGVVLQDPMLFNDTVANNIAYGRPEAGRSAIISAAKAANAHEFIMQLPDGYDTLLGERGGRLSVGERQRITIARCLLKDPPILVLDEATSSLDAESEAMVQEALERLTRGRTTFVIAHRLATVVNASRIMVLKGGRIAESGTHHQLMRLDGYYASLVRRQTRGLLINDGEPGAPPRLAGSVQEPPAAVAA